MKFMLRKNGRGASGVVGVHCLPWIDTDDMFSWGWPPIDISPLSLGSAITVSWTTQRFATSKLLLGTKPGVYEIYKGDVLAERYNYTSKSQGLLGLRPNFSPHRPTQ